MSEPAHDIIQLNKHSDAKHAPFNFFLWSWAAFCFHDAYVPHGVIIGTALPDKVRYNKGTSCMSSDISFMNGEGKRNG